jgi:excisionase family DNA binding protein
VSDAELLQAINAKLDRLLSAGAPSEIVLTRDEAAKQLKVSVRQLQRLIAAGRLLALPSGIARAELERYSRTPQTALLKAMSRGVFERTSSEEAERGRALLKTLRRPRRR